MTSKETTRYIAVMEGEGPGTSRTILATADPDTVVAVVRIIQDRMGRSPASTPPVSGTPCGPSEEPH